MALGDRLKLCPEVAERLDVIELAGLDEAGDAGPGLRAFVVSCEQMILSAKSQRTDPVLNRVAVHLDTAVREEHLQPAPAVGDVGEMLTQTRFGRDACAILFQPVTERSHQRRGAGLADKPKGSGHSPLASGLRNRLSQRICNDISKRSNIPGDARLFEGGHVCVALFYADDCPG